MIGQTLRNYRIIDTLGSGGMGEVFLAEHVRLGRKVAIKVLRPALSAHTEAVERLFAEARATASLNAPEIVQVFDCDVHEGRAYLVMEHLPGETLAARCKRGPLAPDWVAVATIGAQIAAGLAATHASGIVHRDLKPANVFLVSGGAGRPPAVKILDFGVAKLADEVNAAGPSRTRSGELIGTPTYMSPEQCRGRGPVDARADVYALGCILFELVCGHPPFTAEGLGELIAAHLGEPAPPASRFVPGIPRELDDLVAQMLAKNPGDRPQTADEVRVRLEAIVASGGGDPRVARLTPSPSLRTPPPLAPAGGDRHRPVRGLLGAGLAVSALGLAAAGVWAFGSGAPTGREGADAAAKALTGGAPAGARAVGDAPGARAGGAPAAPRPVGIEGRAPGSGADAGARGAPVAPTDEARPARSGEARPAQPGTSRRPAPRVRREPKPRAAEPTRGNYQLIED